MSDNTPRARGQLHDDANDPDLDTDADDEQDTPAHPVVAPDPDGVPPYLTNLSHWVLWREVSRISRKTGETTKTKVPIGYRAGKNCDITNPMHWAAFTDVTAAMDRNTGAFDGYGFVLGDTGQDEWIIGADFDECLDDTEAIAPWAIDPLVIMHTYTDKSPGGHGLKPIARLRAADVPEARRLLGLAENEYARSRSFGEKISGHHAPGVVLYLAKRFFTVTGRPWHGTPEDVALLDLGQIARLAHWFGPKKEATTKAGHRADDDETEPTEAALRDKLGVAFIRNPRLKERWEGGTQGLTDTSRSGRDMSILAFLVNAGFTKGETRAALRDFHHGKLAEEEAAGTAERYFERMWQHTAASPHFDPEPPADWEANHPPADEATPTPNTQNPGPAPKLSRILPGAAFITRHVPPVWLIDGIVQRSRLYACTSITGHGKTAVWLYNACMINAGRLVGQLETFQGNVLYLAGENPADLEARMIGMARTYNIPLDRLPSVLPGSFPLNDYEVDALKKEIAALGLPLALIVGDTASSFFPGLDENDNVQAGGYGRTLRTFTLDCPGNPAVVALCHPIKGADRRSMLLPRGGGAFLNELDGNLANWSAIQGEVTEMHWCGKIRGPDFAPLGYRLRSVPTGLADEKQRPEMTIIAEPMSEEAVTDHAKQTRTNEDVVLKALRDHPDWSLAQIAREAGWVDFEVDKPERWRVQRAISALASDKLIEQIRKGDPWTLTERGEKALKHNP
jgi:hypothetical protein